MFHFALGGFPGLRALASASDPDLAEPTDRVVDERKAGLDGDDANIVNDDIDPSIGASNSLDDTMDEDGPSPAATHGTDSSAPDENAPEQSLMGIGERTEHEKRRTRRGLGRAVIDDSPNMPAVDRMAITTLVLCAVESGIWARAYGDDGWMRILSRAIENLDLGDVPEPIQQQLSSLAAVALYVLREHRPVGGRTGEVLRYEALADKTAYLYAAADADLVAQYAAPLHNSRGFPVDPDDVMRVIAMIVQDDPLADAIDALDARHPTWHVHRHSSAVLHVRGAFRAPFAAAAEVLDAITELPVAAAWATNDRGEWALAARQDTELIHVEPGNVGIVWRHYRLTSLITPTSISRNGDLANRARVRHGPLTQLFPVALAVLKATGIDLAEGPPIECL